MAIKQEALKQFIEKVKTKYNHQIEKIILFGSYARGEAKEESDIDVLIIINKENHKARSEIIGLAFDILLETWEYISPKVISKKDYKRLIKMQSSFIENISNEGIIVG